MTGTMDTRKLLERKRCAQCSKNKAHAYCTLCHHYFHDVPKLLPEGEEKLIAFPTGKRTRAGGPVYYLVENMRFHVWHANGRAKMWGGLCRGAVPRFASVHCGPAVGIDIVVVQREKTVSSLSDVGSDATKSGDVSPA